MLILRNAFVYLSVFLLIFSDITISFAKSRHSPLRSFGDYAQIINPIISASVASQDKGFGHCAIIYGQSLIVTHGIKLVSGKAKWKASKRPIVEYKKDRFDGMPSGHTNSAWVAAAYIRTFSEDYQYASVPLYITAAVTGYSRVKSKEHTISQVVAGAVLAEIITYINSKLEWSNEYRSANFYFGKNEAFAGFEFRL